MNAIKELMVVNWVAVFLGVVVFLIAFKFLAELFEWLVKKFGIETKAMREKRESKELLNEMSKLAQATAKNLAGLQERHTQDEEEFRNNLNNYMNESQKDRRALHEEMKQYSENRIADRKQSFQIQKELTDSIKELAKGQKDRDDKINNLTELFVDKEVDDYRWEIINFAAKVSEGRPCNKDSFKHCLRTYDKYEKLLEKYGLENGEVEISMQVVNKAYEEKLNTGF